MYSVFTMRTLYTLLALISLVLVALGATAAAPNPTLTVNCTLDINGVCTASLGVSFSGAGLNPHKNYAVEGALGGIVDFSHPVVVNPDGTYSAPGELFVSMGSWTFTLIEVGHNGSVKDLVVDGPVLFE